MSLEELRSKLNILNLLWWVYYGGTSMSKYCVRERMYVDNEWDCELCIVCKDRQP